MTIIGKLFFVVLLFASFASSVAAEPVEAATQTAIRDVITKQLDAFAHDDAAGAVAFASNGIRQKFPEPAKFLDMVRTNYAALIKPRRTHFDETATSPSGAVQKVTLVAADGTVWAALYILEQADGHWRITGCSLKKEDQQDI